MNRKKSGAPGKRKSTDPPPNSAAFHGEERPTVPIDLREYARETTGPDVGALSTRSTLDLDPSRVPHLKVSKEELKKLALDHKQGFLISLMDGVSTAELIIDVSGMPEDEVLMAFYDLFVRGVIEFR